MTNTLDYWFDHFQDRAFRYEGLPVYNVPEELEAFEAFKRGKPAPEAWHDDWVKFVREVKNSGRSMERVRLVPEPITNYFQFERLHGYRRSMEAGEDIKLLTSSADVPIGTPDFWLFDDTAVAIMSYGESGEFIDTVVYHDTKNVSRFVELAELLAKL